ncbi:DegQ family serine endoprotease [candidate division KSB1 bacterium]|nr:DegQ family serine endoprotease [candidate division KSB1 bacterium]
MKSRKLSLLVIFGVFVGLVVGLVISSNFNWTLKSIAADKKEVTPVVLGSTTPVSEELRGLESLSKAFVQVSKEVSPSVVTINSEVVVKSRRNPLMDDEFFRYFFRIPDQEDQIRRGLGSGVIVNSDGYILTNNHVVKDADAVTVTLEGKEYDAEIIGKDPESDLAVIKIEKEGLVAIKLGDSDNLEVGEWVLAIGNPFSSDLSKTVTAGIVSAKGRTSLMRGTGITYEDFIQTDAAINPGNSGGPLVNLRGELVGINTAIVGQANIGIGFAIPINLARNVMEQLIKEGRVVRGWLGVMIGNVDENMAEAFGLKDSKGALVSDVVEDSPAEKAGVEAGDIVIKVDDTKIESSDHLTMTIGSKAPGTKVKLTIWRDNKERQLTVTLGERDIDKLTGTPKEEKSTKNQLGLEVQNLTPELAQQYGYENENAVIVTDVTPGSVADRENIRKGFLILSVNRQSVTSVKEFNKIVDDLQPNEVVLFRLKSGDTSFFKALRVPKEK